MVYIYQLLLFLGLTFYIPVLLMRRKGGPTLKQRLGFGCGRVKKRKSRLIWIHAVSLGETKAVGQLARRLKEDFGDDCEIIVSSGTATGRMEAEKAIPFADYYLYLPFDFIWTMKKLARQTSPDLVIISETDLWFNFLSQCKKRGAKLVIVNGKMSEQSFMKYQSFPAWPHRIFGLFDKICVQSEHYAHRFAKLGVAKNVLAVTGNLKLDRKQSQEADLAVWKDFLGLSGNDLILVIGSTHHPEERWLLEILDSLWDSFPNLKVLLVPRHPERFGEVEGLLKQCGRPYQRYSQNNLAPFKILLVDAMGVLNKCYKVCDAAIVGGSYVESVGGHNILEPCEYGVPVIFGPNMKSQPELEELCLSYAAGLQVPMEELSQTLRTVMENKERRRILGQNGLRLIRDNQGATQKTLECIKNS